MECGEICEWMMGRLDELRRAGMYCDASFIIEGNLLPAHRVVLASASRVLQAVLTESNKNELHEVDGVSVSDMQKLIDFLYTGRIDINAENVVNFQNIAEQLDIPILRKVCEMEARKMVPRVVVQGGLEMMDTGENNQAVSADIVHSALLSISETGDPSTLVDDNKGPSLQSALPQLPAPCLPPAGELPNTVLSETQENCELCGSTFASSIEARQHVVAVHAMDMYECRHCHARLYPLAEWEQHEIACRVQHNKKAGCYNCPKCAFFASNVPTVVKHYRTEHINKRRQTCEHCGLNVVGSLSGYYEHLLRRHHVDVVSKFPYVCIHQCTECNFKTTKHPNVKFHQRHHPSYITILNSYRGQLQNDSMTKVTNQVENKSETTLINILPVPTKLEEGNGKVSEEPCSALCESEEEEVVNMDLKRLIGKIQTRSALKAKQPNDATEEPMNRKVSSPRKQACKSDSEELPVKQSFSPNKRKNKSTKPKEAEFPSRPKRIRKETSKMLAFKEKCKEVVVKKEPEDKSVEEKKQVEDEINSSVEDSKVEHQEEILEGEDDESDYEKVKQVGSKRKGRKPKGAINENCEICGKHFLRLSTLRRHMNLEHKNMLPKCQICNREFYLRRFLHNHEDRCIIFSNKPVNGKYHCPVDGCNVSSSVNHTVRLVRHYREAHTDRQVRTCPHCSEVINGFITYMDHLFVQHDVDVTKLSAGRVRMHRCTECDFKTTRAKSLRAHENMHNGPFTCSLCGKTFSTQWLHDQHINIVHNNVRKYHCEYCTFTTNARYIFNSHRFKQHKVAEAEQVFYQCSQCDYTNVYRSAIKRHEDETHSTTEKYLCSYCSKGFKSRSCLRNHEKKQHINKKTFACEVCTFSTLHRREIGKHMETQHPDYWPYMCHSCGKQFRHSANIKYHISNCYRQKIYRDQPQVKTEVPAHCLDETSEAGLPLQEVISKDAEVIVLQPILDSGEELNTVSMEIVH